jgi:hypothetical protein
MCYLAGCLASLFPGMEDIACHSKMPFSQANNGKRSQEVGLLGHEVNNVLQIINESQLFKLMLQFRMFQICNIKHDA